MNEDTSYKLEERIQELEATLRDRDAIIANFATNFTLSIIIGPLFHEFSHNLSSLDLLLRNFENDFSAKFTGIQRRSLDQILMRLDELRGFTISAFSLYSGQKKELWLHELPDLFNQVRTTLKPVANGRGIIMEFSADFLKTRKLNATKSSLFIVLVNLILNSFDALQNKRFSGKVRVAIDVQKDSAKLRVWDNGYGIEKSQIPLITNPGFTTNPNRMGLGLTISRSLVNEWGGALTIQSTEFEFTEVELTL